MLASRFANHSPSLRSDYPLSDDQIRRVAPSIFADAPHESRSHRYAYIPTSAVLTELRKEGLHGRSANGRRQQTRPVQGIDSDIRLKRALWLLADGMRQLKA